MTDGGGGESSRPPAAAAGSPPALRDVRLPVQVERGAPNAQKCRNVEKNVCDCVIVVADGAYVVELQFTRMFMLSISTASAWGAVNHVGL